MSKIILIVTLSLSLFFVSCRGIAPIMDGTVKIWNGAPEKGGICRLSDPNDPLSEKCIDAYDDEFKKYGCMTFNDSAILQQYIETLLNRCKKWKK